MHNVNGLQEQTVNVSKPQKKRGWLRYFVILCLVGFLVILTVSIIGVARFATGVAQGKESLDLAQESALELDFITASDQLTFARNGFENAQSGLHLLTWTRVIPWVGNQVQAVTIVVDSGIDSLSALESAVEVASDLSFVIKEAQKILEATDIPEGEYTYDQFPDEIKEQLLQTLHQSHPQLVEMQVKLRLAADRLNDLQNIEGITPKLLEAIAPFEEMLPEIVAGVDVLVPLSASVGELAGIGEDRQWLVLFLNNTEMRPAGGFMGAFGLMLVRDGEIKNMNVADTYSIDKLVQGNPDYISVAPEPLSRYVGVDKWYFRDANWSPDFPTSAVDSMQLLRQEVAFTGQPAPYMHGVIGITPTFVESILRIIGPVTVSGMTFTDKNITELLEFEVEFGYEDRGISSSERKDIIGYLSEEVIKQLYALPVNRWGEVFYAIQQNIEEKQLALYSRDEFVQSAFVDAKWAAHTDPSGFDDVLMVVDANMAALKTDASMERHITYSIEKSGDDYIATTKIQYTNFGSFDLFTSRYRTYTRVYAPLGSELISVKGSLKDDKLKNPGLLPGDVTATDDLLMTSFGTFTSIEPGTTGELIFTYKLPNNVKEAIKKNVYQLKVFKQMGADNHALTLDLDFGKKVRVAQPSEESLNFGDTSYTVNTDLDHDLAVSVQF